MEEPKQWKQTTDSKKHVLGYIKKSVEQSIFSFGSDVLALHSQYNTHTHYTLHFYQHISKLHYQCWALMCFSQWRCLPKFSTFKNKSIYNVCCYEIYLKIEILKLIGAYVCWYVQVKLKCVFFWVDIFTGLYTSTYADCSKF